MPSSRNLLAACIPVVLVTYEERAGQCRFAVLETDDPLAGYSDKIEQRFTGQQESG